MSDREEYLKRLNYIDGHLKGVRKMVEDEKYCAEILRQTFAVRKSIEKLESMMLDAHLRNCVSAGIKEGREDQVINELLELYSLAEK